MAQRRGTTRRATTRRPSVSRRTAGQERSYPKTTRPEAVERREPERVRSAGERMQRTLDALPDRVDIRDWVYQPRLGPLPDQVVNCDFVPAILDQGQEGACTGFALAAVIGFHLETRQIQRRVSPRMLYELARRYDEWPGEDYVGSSARGAMMGWVRHGVCPEQSWTADQHGTEHFTPEIAAQAQGTPGGAYYRVMHRQVRDMHAALAEVGILYATLMVHEGWGEPGPLRASVTYGDPANPRTRELPIIERRGRADSGHAVAIVGYTAAGFIVQNSWGPGWGADGFALLPYEDFLIHAVDVWAAQLGVPVTVDLWTEGAADSSAGVHRALPAISLNEIRPYVVNVGNNGELSGTGKYWTTEGDLARLFQEVIPAATERWTKRRVLLYLHGGLNDEQTVARRVIAFRNVLLENEIYPLHVLWESGLGDSLRGLLEDLFTDVDERAPMVADWLRNFREGLLEAKDRTLELTASSPGTGLWDEMKENARLSSEHPLGRGAMQLIAKYAAKGLGKAGGAGWEVHVVGHSAGCIYSAFAMPHLKQLGKRLKTLQLLAPALRVDLFKRLLLPLIEAGACPEPSVYLLSDVGERDDDVGPYGKSLLYLVSNAFEGGWGTPLLGMHRFIEQDPELAEFFGTNGKLPGLIVAGAAGGPGSISRSNSHGGFDNDPDTLNSVLYRVLGREPKRPFSVRDLQF